MEHALNLKKIEMETESIKMGKYHQTNALKEQTNVLDHEQKLKTIKFTASTHQRGKAKELKQKANAKLKKYQGDFNNTGVLHNELRKQNTMNGGCRMTFLTDVSISIVSTVLCSTN
jgi:hypothetical protein